MSITVQDVEALRNLLADLPKHQAREVTKQEAVELLAKEIRAAQRRGYPPEEIARILSERGVPINVGTLRGYLRRTGKSGKSPRRSTLAKSESERPVTGSDEQKVLTAGRDGLGSPKSEVGTTTKTATERSGDVPPPLGRR